MTSQNENKKINQIQEQVIELQKQTAVSDERQENQLAGIKKELIEMKALILSTYATKQEVAAQIDHAKNDLNLVIQKNEVVNAQSRKIVFGMVAIILTGVVTAVIALVVK